MDRLGCDPDSGTSLAGGGARDDAEGDPRADEDARADGDARLSVSFRVAYSYPVLFTNDLLDPENPVLVESVSDGEQRGLMLAVLDEGMLAHHPSLPARLEAYAHRHAGRLELAGFPVVLPGGEVAKEDVRHTAAVLDAINDRAVDRHSYVLAIGGGALLDVAGYAAGIAHRGVRLVRVPTTVLSQNDAGIGVKNGINAYGKKNFIGTFAPPAAVIDDELFLTTLSDRDWLAGASEAIKVALLKDASFFASLEQLAPVVVSRDMRAMGMLVRRCAALHTAHIASEGDPFELGSARPLDFGHWSAHKLERLSGLRLRHGEAVAIGIALDSTYARFAGLLSAADHERVLAAIAAYRLPISAPELADPRLLEGLAEFREHLGGRLTVTLAPAIGESLEIHDVDQALMQRALEELLERSAGQEGQQS